MAYIGRSVDIGMFEKQVLTPDSSTTTFTLTFAVGSANSLLVVYGGVIQEPAVAYSVSGGGQSIVFSEAPATGTTLYIIYLGKQLTTPRAAGQETTKQTFTGDGTTTLFTLTDPPVVPAGIMVFVDGILQREGSGNNFVSSGSTINFSAAPDNGAEIDVYTLVKEKVSIDTVADGSITRAKLAASAPYWDANGYVGIGDATPTSTGYKLSVKDASAPFIGMTGTANGAHALALFRTAQSSGGQIGVVDTAAQQIVGSVIGDMIVRTNTSNSKILFSTDTGATSTLTITGGNVGVGTNTPSNALDVYRASTGVGVAITSASTGASDFANFLVVGNDVTARISAYGSNHGVRGNQVWFNANTNTPLILATNNTERARLDTSGNLSIANGNLVLASGKGIDFSAGSNAAGVTSELLDDYEVGTFQPALTAGGVTPTGYSVYSAVGYYVKVGRVVTCTFGIGATWTSASGSLVITNLPFTEGVGGGYREPGMSIANTNYTGNVLRVAVVSSSTYCNVYKGGNGAALTAADVGTNFFVHGTLTYIAS